MMDLLQKFFIFLVQCLLLNERYRQNGAQVSSCEKGIFRKKEEEREGK